MSIVKLTLYFIIFIVFIVHPLHRISSFSSFSSFSSKRLFALQRSKYSERPLKPFLRRVWLLALMGARFDSRGRSGGLG